MEKGKVAPAQLNIFCMSALMTVTTIIAGWHITDVWSGLVAMLCGLVTIWFVGEGVKVYGEADTGRKRECKAV